MYVNLTPHPVVVHFPDGSVGTFPPSGVVARLAQTDTTRAPIEGVPTLETSLGAALNCEPRRRCSCGTSWDIPANGHPRCCDICNTYGVKQYLIVSAMMLPALAGREDVIAPATGPNHGAIRDSQGRIIAVTKWLRAAAVGS